MEEKKKINFKELAKNTIEFSNEKYKEAKNFTTKTAMPKLKETAKKMEAYNKSPFMFYTKFFFLRISKILKYFL